MNKAKQWFLLKEELYMVAEEERFLTQDDTLM